MHVYPRAGDFYNIHFVITALFTVPSFVERRVEESFGSQIVGIQLPAGQSEPCLFKSYAFAVFKGIWRESAFECLVYIPSGF